MEEKVSSQYPESTGIDSKAGQFSVDQIARRIIFGFMDILRFSWVLNRKVETDKDGVWPEICIAIREMDIATKQAALLPPEVRLEFIRVSGGPFEFLDDWSQSALDAVLDLGEGVLGRISDHVSAEAWHDLVNLPIRSDSTRQIAESRQDVAVDNGRPPSSEPNFPDWRIYSEAIRSEGKRFDYLDDKTSSDLWRALTAVEREARLAESALREFAKSKAPLAQQRGDGRMRKTGSGRPQKHPALTKRIWDAWRTKRYRNANDLARDFAHEIVMEDGRQVKVDGEFVKRVINRRGKWLKTQGKKAK